MVFRCIILGLLTPAKGKWISPHGTLFSERMIPVRIGCNRGQIIEILEMSKKYYNQLAMLAYKISEEVIII